MLKQFQSLSLEELAQRLAAVRAELMRAKGELAAKRLRSPARLRALKREIARLVQALAEKGG